MSECLAAREDDEIAHTASKGWMIAGLVGGAILGAAAVVVTGGTALVAVSAVAAGACAAGGLGELLGSMSWAPRHTTGTLKDGSPNVFINSRKAIRAHLSAGECDEHSGSLQRVAEGLIKVYINNFPASRIGDKLTCSAEISQGSRNVIIGGSKVQTDEISPEIAEWVNWTMLAVGAGAMAVLASPAIALLSTLGAMGGGTVGSYAGGMLFGEGSDGQKWGMLIGSVIGGGAGMKGGARFDAWRAGKPVLEPVKPNISARRAELNEKFGRTGDLNRDINIRANQKIVDDFMRSQGVEESKIPAYRTGIDLEQRMTIETINKGKIAYQNQSPGNWQGNWYSLDESTPATKLGINPEGQVRDTGLIVPKEVKAYQAQQEGEMHRSSATPALDTWSIPDKPFQTEGGGYNGLPLSVIFGLHIMNDKTALNYVDKALILAKKRYAEVKNLNPHAPLLQMYGSIVQQLLFLRDLIEGKEKDKARLWKMTFGMYAAKEFDNSDELFFERLSDAWFIVDQIRRGLKVRLPHEVDANYSIKQQNLKMKYPNEF